LGTHSLNKKKLSETQRSIPLKKKRGLRIALHLKEIEFMGRTLLVSWSVRRRKRETQFLEDEAKQWFIAGRGVMRRKSKEY